MSDEDNDVLEEHDADTDNVEVKKKPTLYKGKVFSAKELAAQFTQGMGPTPVQPVVRSTKSGQLPPSFVATRFQPYFGGRYMLHYYVPRTRAKSYREVGPEFALNVLTGRQGETLAADLKKAMADNLSGVSGRLQCSVGTDPEVFVVDKKGRVVPAWEFLPGKDAASKYTTTDGIFHGTAYWDGFQAEFTTHPGLTCLMQMADCVQRGLKVIHDAQAAKVKGGLTLQSVLPVDPDFLMKHAEEEPAHIAFGCAPSHNLYGLSGNLQEGKNVPYRFAGGHIHLGLHAYTDGGKMPEERIKEIVRGLDAVLGVACVSLFASFDQPIRRQFYGLPGEYRLPAHGLEYRTLSNAWLSHPLITNMVFDLARAVGGVVLDGALSLWKGDEKETIDVILNHDVGKAREILERNKALFLQILRVIGSYYSSQSQLDTAYRIWTTGLEGAIAEPGNLVKNWRLGSSWVSHGGPSGSNFYTAYGTLVAGGKV